MMKSRYLFFSLLAGMSVFLGAQSSAACQDIRFPDGKSFCFDIHKTSSEHFESKVSASQVSSSELTCKLTLPNGTILVLPRCEGSFSYWGSDGKITLRADRSNYWYELIAYYDFRNGSFSSSYSPTSNWQGNYSPEIVSVSTDRPQKDQWIDLNLRVRNSGTSQSYNGNINFRVERYTNGRWESATSYDYELERSRVSFSSYEYGEKRLDRFLRFKTEWEFRLYAQLEDGRTTSRDFFVASPSSPRTWYRPEWSNVSTLTPDQNQWIDLTLKVQKSLGAEAYQGGVDFRVEVYANGKWEVASRYDYELDKTNYYFSSSDQGGVRLHRFLLFKNRGEFRVLAQLRNGAYDSATQSFTVRGSSSAPSFDSRVDRLSITHIAPNQAREHEWIDVTVKALDRYGNKASDYEGTLRFVIEEYRSGAWRTARSSDYQLQNTTRSLVRSDLGEKTFYGLLKFTTSGTFRLKVVDDMRSTLYTTREINIYGTSYQNQSSTYWGNLYFTSKELSKIRTVSSLRKDVIASLEKDYPRLRRDTYWKSLSDTFYSNMQDVLREDRSARFKNWQEFYSAFQEWFSYTVRTR